MAQSPYQLIDLTENITLSWPSSFSGGPVILDINDLDADQDDWKLILPDATLVQAGQNFVLNNVSGFSIDITANDTSTVLVSLASGEVVELYLISNATTNGTWRIIPFGGGASSITQFTAQSSDSSIVITNGTVTPPTGMIDFQLTPSMFNLNALNATNFVVSTAVSPLTFTTVELIGGENIIISNGDGIIGNPIIDLNPVLTSLTSMSVGDMTLSGEVITNNTVNGNVQISTNGTGKIQMNGVEIDTSGNLSGVTNLVSPSGYFLFTDTVTGMSNTIVVLDQVNIASVTGSAGTYVLTFTTPQPTLNYGVVMSLGTTGGDLPFISNAYVTVRELTAVTIVVTDASGELVLAVPNGISGIIISS